MKNNPVTMVLVGAVILVELLCAVCLYSYNTTFRHFQESQAKVADLQNKGIGLQALAVDLNEYGKRHPDIEPLLQAHGMKLSLTNLPAAAKSPAK